MDLLNAWRAAQVGELIWDTPDGPDALPVVPLSDAGVPCVALPYASLARADALTAAGTAVACLSDPTLARGAGPMTAHVRVRRVDDLDGERFETSQLLLQELAKHPPSRRRLDSILLRREHWWFLPRILLHLEVVGEPRPLTPTGALLGRRVSAPGTTGAATVEVSAVTVSSRSSSELTLEGAPTPSGGPAVLLEHGAEPPDLERTWGTRTTGTLDGALLSVREVDRWGRQDRMPTLLQRIRDERALERACRSGLRASGHAG
jgi:hypothetical protein